MIFYKYLILLVSLLITFNLRGETVTALTEEKINAIEVYIQNLMAEKKIPGLVVGVFDKDSILFKKAYGLADLSNLGPVREETTFEIASITKQFTASAILLLQQDGKLNIDDSIHKYMPESPESWKAITIKHLLNHTSGITTRDSWPGKNEMSGKRVRRENANWSKQYLIDSLITHEPSHPPGEVFVYGDPAYALLGIVIDNITGNFREFMQSSIFNPLGMNSTYYVDHWTVHPFQARGYTLRNGELINNRRSINTEISSWSTTYSNITDMQKWDAALNSNLILTEESKALLWQNYPLNNGEPTGYGFGWSTNKLGGYDFVSHNGITGPEWAKFPEQNMSILILNNLGYEGWDPVQMSGITFGIASIMGLKVAVNSDYITNSGLKVIPFDETSQIKFIGDYELKAAWGGGKVKIYVSDSKMYMSITGVTLEMGLLENGSLITFGIQREDILIPNEDHSQLIFSDGSAELIKITK